jgi:8-oxo-dGTP pyrophosphatase MutT (NUDIX family)
MERKRRPAAVAIVVAPGEAGDELLLIRRATVTGDPWSGHIALPGGGSEAVDASLEDTARRETLEETGIDLAASGCIAALGAVNPRSRGAPSVSVTPFVFRYEGDRHVTMSREIVEAWWIPVQELRQPEAWQMTSVPAHDGSTIEARGFQLRGHVLWGLTERILDEFLGMWPG